MDKQTYRLVHSQARQLALEAIKAAPDGYYCTISEPTRTLDQNCYQWPYLLGFAQQLQWPVNGVMVWLTKDEWKDILTAAFENDIQPRLAMGFDGGVVMLGRRTSQYGKAKFCLWMEWLMAAAAIKGVKPVFKNRAEEEDFTQQKWGAK